MIFDLLAPPQGPMGRAKKKCAVAHPIHVSNSHTKFGWILSNGLGRYSVTDGRIDVSPILNIGPVYKGPLIRGQESEIKGQFSSELTRYYQTDKLLWAISSLDVHHHRLKMALF